MASAAIPETGKVRQGDMAATVHTFPNGRTAPPQEVAGPASAIVEGLSNRVRAVFSELTRKMFEGADDALFEMSEKSRNNEEQRLYFDTMRVLRIEQSRIVSRFLTLLGEALLSSGSNEAGAVNIDFEHLSLKPTEALEESIAISNMEAKADGLYRDLIWELDRRLDTLSRTYKVQLTSQCLAPASLCGAFRRAVEPLDIEFDIKLVVYKLFDRSIIRSLGEFYAQTLNWLESQGIKSVPTAPTVEPSRWTPAGATVDRATLDALRALGEGMPSAMGGGASERYGAAASGGSIPNSLSGSAPGQFSDASLAAELASTLGGSSANLWAQAATQRLALVGRLFADILGDPNVPSSLKPSLEQLRFPVIKTALSDPGFFNDAQHPVRSLIHEIATMVAASRAVDGDAQREVEWLVREVRNQFDLNPESVRPSLRDAEPLGKPDIEGFLGQIEVQARIRREAILGKVKRIVAEELTLRTVGRDVPASAWPLFNAGWAPLMCVRLLRYGVRSSGWTDGLARLDEVLAGMRSIAADAEIQHRRDAVIAALSSDLRKVGMSDDKCARLLAGLRQAYAEFDSRDATPAATQAAPEVPAEPVVSAEHGAPQAVTELVPEPAMDAAPFGTSPDMNAQKREGGSNLVSDGDTRRLLDLLCTPGAWFRVLDREQQRTRWLRVNSFHPQRDAIAFVEFDGTAALQLRVSVLLGDLRDGRSEPINPDPFAKTLLDRVIRGEAAA